MTPGRKIAIIITVILVFMFLCAVAVVVWVVKWTLRRKNKVCDVDLGRMTGVHEKEGIKDGIIRVDGPVWLQDLNEVIQVTNCMKTTSTILE